MLIWVREEETSTGARRENKGGEKAAEDCVNT